MRSHMHGVSVSLRYVTLARNDKQPLSKTPKHNHVLLSLLVTLLICSPPKLL